MQRWPIRSPARSIQPDRRIRLWRRIVDDSLQSYRLDPYTWISKESPDACLRIQGKDWHAAALNFGDSFAYSLAIEHRCPLLFVGDAFAKTDVVSALAG